MFCDMLCNNCYNFNRRQLEMNDRYLSINTESFITELTQARFKQKTNAILNSNFHLQI